jgi:hypothetical protein
VSDDCILVNNEFEKKLPWPNLRHCPAVGLEKLRKTTKTSAKIVGLQVEILNWSPTEYKSKVFSCEQTSTVLA